MELQNETIHNIQKYDCAVFILDSVDAVESTDVSAEIKDLVRNKISTDKETCFLKVEDVKKVYIFLWVKQDFDFELLDEIRKAGARIWGICAQKKLASCVLVPKLSSEVPLLACVEGVMLRSYTFTIYKSEQKEESFQTLACVNVSPEFISQVSITTHAVFAARDFINEPVITLSAGVFAQRIATMFANTGADVAIRDKKWIEKENMGGVLAVNKGSIDEPCFVHIQWNPLQKETQPLVLVGKGIVFDTGGLSIKTPSTYMETMKADMGGAAVVAAALKALVDMNAQEHIHVLIPITDNRLSGNAYAPGDVIKMRSGTTVEVLNTDAEGRMILADALDYAKELHPKLVVDVATLTGAANAAVGEHAAVCMGTAKQEMEQLKQSSMQVWEPLVELPLWKQYEKQIASEIADIKNVGGPLAGAITAGKFLQKFTDYPWIHIDISGSAFMKSRYSYKGFGGTGFGVRMLVDFVKKSIE